MRNKNEYLTSILSKILLVGLAFVNSILINRYLGPELRGEYAFILNVANIFTIILGFNIATSYPYLSKKYGKDIFQKFVNIIFFQFLIYIIGIIIFIFYIPDKIIISIILISVVAQFGNQLDFLSIISNVNKRNMILIIAAIFNTLFLTLLFFKTNNNLDYIVLALLLYNLVKIVLFITRNKYFIRKKIGISIPLIEITKFSFFPMVITLFTIFNYSLDVIILKFFVENEQLGLYSVGVTLASMLWIIPDAFKDVLFNRTAKDDSIKAIILSIKINLYLCFIIIIGFVVIGKPFISLVYGIEYAEAYIVSIILFLGTIPMIFFKLINTLYQAIGKQKFSFIILFISVFFNVIMNFLLIPYFGIAGAAISSVLSYAICGIVILISFVRKYSINYKDIFFFNKSEKNMITKIISKSKN